MPRGRKTTRHDDTDVAVIEPSLHHGGVEDDYDDGDYAPPRGGDHGDHGDNGDHGDDDLNSTRRAGFTNGEKRALREWVQSQPHKPTQRECIDWFYQRFHRRISQSGVSRCLSEKNKHLDLSTLNGQLIRNRYGKYPILEDILSDWQQIQIRSGGIITASILMKKAEYFWHRIPEYRGKAPDLNYRWLDRFKRRHNIMYSAEPRMKRFKSNGLIDTSSVTAETAAAVAAAATSAADAAVLATDPALFAVHPAIEEEDDEALATAALSPLEQIRVLQTLYQEYSDGLVYSLGATGLYWKRELVNPNSVPVASAAGRIDTDIAAQDVARSALLAAQHIDAYNSKFSVILCTSSTGADRLPLWFVGSGHPPSIDGVNLNSLGAKWVERKDPSIDLLTMRHWLAEFYLHVGSHRALLVLEDIPIYTEALKLAPPPGNIRAEFLPHSHGREFGGMPLEQGVVRQWKAFYHAQWMRFMADSFSNGVNPSDSVNVYQAIRWAARAWQHDVSDITILNGFRGSALVTNHITPLPEPDMEPDLMSIYEEVKAVNPGAELLPLDHFINLHFEEADIGDQSENAVLDAIVERRLGMIAGDDGSVNEGPGESTASAAKSMLLGEVPTTGEALEYCQQLIRYAVHQPLLSREHVEPLERLESFLLKEETSSTTLSKIDTALRGA